ncbi:MAG: PAS domain S-box protein [Leptospirales bacterium]|nr:PAS domain S-box protein [Leptospirales bacterium]
MHKDPESPIRLSLRRDLPGLPFAFVEPSGVIVSSGGPLSAYLAARGDAGNLLECGLVLEAELDQARYALQAPDRTDLWGQLQARFPQVDGQSALPARLHGAWDARRRQWLIFWHPQLEDLQTMEMKALLLERFALSTPEPAMVADLQGRVLYSNQAANEICEFFAGATDGGTLDDCLSFEDPGIDLPAKLSEIGSADLVARTRSGLRLTTRCVLVFDPTGHPLGIVVHIRSDSGAAQAESALSDDATRHFRMYRQIVEGSSESIVLADLSGTILFANRAAGRLYGRDPAQISGQNLDLLARPSAELSQAIVAGLRDLGHWSGETKHRRLIVEGEERDFEAFQSMDLLFDDQGNPLGIISMSRDVTPLREAERDAHAKQAEIIRLQEAFVEDLEKQVRERTAELAREKDRTQELLLNILPADTAEELKLHGRSEPRSYGAATVLFSDFAGFTTLVRSLSPEEIVHILNDYFVAFDHIMTRHGLEKIKTIGDAYMAVSGVPHPRENSAASAVRAALDMQDYVEAEARRRTLFGKAPWRIRVGLHSGPVVAGVVGEHKFAYDIWGDAVNVANRLEAAGEVGRVNVSEDTWRLVQHAFEGEARGSIAIKNRGEIRMWWVNGPRLEPM